MEKYGVTSFEKPVKQAETPKKEANTLDNLAKEVTKKLGEKKSRGNK